MNPKICQFIKMFEKGLKLYKSLKKRQRYEEEAMKKAVKAKIYEYQCHYMESVCYYQLQSFLLDSNDLPKHNLMHPVKMPQNTRGKFSNNYIENNIQPFFMLKDDSKQKVAQLFLNYLTEISANDLCYRYFIYVSCPSFFKNFFEDDASHVYYDFTTELFNRCESDQQIIHCIHLVISYIRTNFLFIKCIHDSFHLQLIHISNNDGIIDNIGNDHLLRILSNSILLNICFLTKYQILLINFLNCQKGKLENIPIGQIFYDNLISYIIRDWSYSPFLSFNPNFAVLLDKLRNQIDKEAFYKNIFAGLAQEQENRNEFIPNKIIKEIRDDEPVCCISDLSMALFAKMVKGCGNLEPMFLCSEEEIINSFDDNFDMAFMFRPLNIKYEITEKQPKYESYFLSPNSEKIWDHHLIKSKLEGIDPFDELMTNTGWDQRFKYEAIKTEMSKLEFLESSMNKYKTVLSVLPQVKANIESLDFMISLVITKYTNSSRLISNIENTANSTNISYLIHSLYAQSTFYTNEEVKIKTAQMIRKEKKKTCVIYDLCVEQNFKQKGEKYYYSISKRQYRQIMSPKYLIYQLFYRFCHHYEQINMNLEPQDYELPSSDLDCRNSVLKEFLKPITFVFKTMISHSQSDEKLSIWNYINFFITLENYLESNWSNILNSNFPLTKDDFLRSIQFELYSSCGKRGNYVFIAEKYRFSRKVCYEFKKLYSDFDLYKSFNNELMCELFQFKDADY